uniref:rhomboid protease n=1 Tax=Nothobranchius rachovii TaxID=451742 RepID=A0A1A8RN55_9TELE
MAELGVFIYYAVWKPQKRWITLEEGIWRSPLTYTPDKREEAWRFISYMFVHAGVEHIVGNLLMQLLLGIPLELVHKGFEVGMVYLSGVLAGIVAGMTIGYVFFSAYNQKLLKDPRFWICIVGYILFFLFAVIYNVVFSPAP